MTQIQILSLPQPYVISAKEKSPDNLRLNSPYKFTFKFKGKTYDAVIPKGFLFDGASIPRWAWSLLNAQQRGLHDPAALVHDYMYVKRGVFEVVGGKTLYMSRKETDQFFLKATQFLNIKSPHVRLAYWAIRAFGGWK